MSNKEIGEQILQGLGGPENISHITHCATRLRVTPKSRNAIASQQIEKIPGVLSIIEQSGQTQVILGDKVEAVYNEMVKLPGMNKVGSQDSAGDQGEQEKAGLITRVFDVLSDSFRPVLWALLGSSMILTLIVLLQQIGFFGTYTNFAGEDVVKDLVNGPKLGSEALNSEMLNQWRADYSVWFLLLAAALSVLNFMPIMIGATAAKRLGANMWVGAAIPAALMTDAFRGLSEILPADQDYITLFHLGNFAVPLYLFSYTGQIFPPLFAVALLAPLERFLKRVIPTMLHMVFVPMISLLIMVPLTALAIGPFGILLGRGISDLFGNLNEVAPWLVGAVIAGSYLFMVPLGLHWPLNAVMINNLQTLGEDFIQSPMGAFNFAVFGSVTAVAIRAGRNKELRQTATGASISGLLGGISEPSLYGVVLRYKRVIPIILVPAVIGGALISMLGVKSYAFAFTSLLSIPAMQPSLYYVLGLAVAFFGAFAGVLIFGYEQKTSKLENKESGQQSEPAAGKGAAAAAANLAGGASAAAGAATAGQEVLTISAPLAGQAIALAEVNDPVFAGEKLGKGAAIEPSGSSVYAPAAGKVIAAPASGHALGLRLDNGVELLIHVGIDTVNLKGEGFNVLVSKGQTVSAGQQLLSFDREIISKAGYPLTTPVLITNTAKYSQVTASVGQQKEPGDELIQILP